MDIVLSHYHLDYIIGLNWLPKIWAKKFSLYAPTTPLVDCEYWVALDKLTTPSFFALPLKQYPGGVDVIPINLLSEVKRLFENTFIPREGDVINGLI